MGKDHTVNVKYIAGIGIDRPTPLPISKQRSIIGHKVIRMHWRDATELLQNADFEKCPDNAKVDIDFCKPEEAAIIIEGFKDNLQNIALELEEKTIAAKEDLKAQQREDAEKRKISERPSVTPEKPA